jgi:copper transport protein
MSLSSRGPIILAALLFALAAMAVEAAPASAHAAFLESTPAPGQRVQRSPREITLEFTEALNRRLSRATITDLRTSRKIATTTLSGPSQDLVLRPAAALGTAAYRVDWFSVSTDDGHPLAGSFSFGVRTAAVGGAHVIEQDPLAREGWLRVALRAVFYCLLIFFAGGIFNAVLLAGREGRARWLVPPGELRLALDAAGRNPEPMAAVAWRRTVSVGWAAAAAAAAVALAEAADAAGGLAPAGLNDYLLTNTAGLGRVATVLALALAALLAGRLPRLAALSCAASLAAISLSGHADSADPRVLAVAVDWLHLLAAAVWIGGIAQIAVAWLGPVLRVGPSLGGAVMREVLRPFGRVALPAFLIVVVSGLSNALIELGEPQALWQTGYGRTLAVKMGLVVSIAILSYLHARRLRPRLLAADPHPDPGQERRHWRLLCGEPALGVAVLAVAALLVAYPLPPRQLSGAESAAVGQGGVPCRPSCPLPKLKSDQLAVADSVGSSIVAAWVRQVPTGLMGELRLYDAALKPPAWRPTVAGAELSACGPGCWRFRVPGRPATIAVSVPEDGRLYAARLPVRWQAGRAADERARKLLVRAQATMSRLRSLRQYERVTSGPGSLAVSHYRLEAPDRFSMRTNLGFRSITVGKYTWETDDAGPLTARTHWVRGPYAGGGPGFSTSGWFRWTPYAQAVRLLGEHRVHGHNLAEIALYDQGTPAWWRFTIDLRSMRTTDSRLITKGHYATQRYYGFDRPSRISPPGRGP